MRFSVIIPSYNQAAYLKDAISSVLAQTFEDFELIVIDDGSTDNSLEIAKEMQVLNNNRHDTIGTHVVPFTIISQVNKGLASARNTGIMNAVGEYIYPLDADDIMRETCLEKVDEALKRTNADILAPSFMAFGVENTMVQLMPEPKIEDFWQANRIGYFSAIRKSKLLEIGGYSPRMTWGYEDYHLWFDLLKRGAKLVTIPDYLILYRTKNQSMIHTAKEKHTELMAQINKDHGPHN